MALASTDLLLTVPFATFVLYSNPWVSWADTHSNFSRVMQVPGIYWRGPAKACALLFFAYFGFADEAIKNYRGAFNSVAIARSASGLSSTGCLRNSPTYTTHMRDLFDSFSDMSASYGGTSPLEYEDKEKALILGDDGTRADTRRRARD
ncbi:hypothetical protein B0H13DRAFT_2025197 [Mycena leptocephala]|nr:hypothetical protein B0H13DRAFT_2025197 [Mycena leptocephala]